MSPETGFLLITTHGNWERLAREKRWVFDRQRAMLVDLKGKSAVVYLTANGGQSSIGGLVTFKGELTEVAVINGFTQVFPWEVPIRVDVKLISPIDIYAVKESLQFLPKKSNWGSALQGQPLKKIPASDFEFLRAKLVAKAANEQRFAEAPR